MDLDKNGTASMKYTLASRKGSVGYAKGGFIKKDKDVHGGVPMGYRILWDHAVQVYHQRNHLRNVFYRISHSHVISLHEVMEKAAQVYQ